jgi:hypothetical protein
MTNRLVDPLLLERPLELEWPETHDRKSAPRVGVSNKRRASSVSGLLMLLLAALVIAPAAQAGDTVCGGTPTEPAVLSGGPYDNVVVPEGRRCFIQFAVIRGNVKALPDSFLTIVQTQIGGNIIGDKADMVQVAGGNTVGGDIHVKEGGPNLLDAQEVNITGNTLTNGDILVQKMRIAKGLLVGFGFGGNDVRNGDVTVEDNVIVAGTDVSQGMRVHAQQIANGNLHVFKNTGPGAKSVMHNDVVRGDIQCYENEQPFVGGPNMGRAPNQPPVVFPPLTGKNQCIGTST